jgi:hypothetical protein
MSHYPVISVDPTRPYPTEEPPEPNFCTLCEHEWYGGFLLLRYDMDIWACNMCMALIRDKAEESLGDDSLKQFLLRDIGELASATAE